MKYPLWLLTAGTLILALSSERAVAQGCISFQPDFSEYVSETTDGTYIYTSVTFDGTGDMTITNPGSPSCPPGTPVHTAYTENYLSWTGGSQGGWSPGQSGCPDCYFSSTNNQSINGSSGDDYSFTWGAEAICSVAGTFFNTGGNIKARIAQTSWGPPPTELNDQCYYTLLACSSGKPTCSAVEGITFVPACPKYMKGETLVLNGVCIYPTIGVEAGGPGSCN